MFEGSDKLEGYEDRTDAVSNYCGYEGHGYAGISHSGVPITKVQIGKPTVTKNNFQ